MRYPLPKQLWWLRGMSTKKLECWLLRCHFEPILMGALHGEGQQGCRSMVGQSETILELAKNQHGWSSCIRELTGQRVAKVS